MLPEPPTGIDRPVRVLQLGSPAGMFGAERWIMALAKHLPRDQVECVIGVIQDEATGKEPPLCEHARALGFETLTIQAPGKLSAQAVGGLRRAIADLRIDVLHTHFYKPTILGAIAVRSTNCKLLATPHGWNTDAGLKLQAYEWLERLAFARADLVAPLSNELEQGLNLLPWLKGKVRLINNGVDLSEVSDSSEVAIEVHEAKAAGAFVIGYIGQLIARKRVETLIDAFAKMYTTNAVLFIIGDGDQRDALECQAKRLNVAARVKFMGFRNDRLDFLRGFNVLVLPSSLEGIPRCLMEAMVAGVPIVGTDIPGITELIEDNQTGWLVRVGDDFGLSLVLENINSDLGRSEKIASKAQEKVNNNFSAARMATEYSRVYLEMMENNIKNRKL